MSACVADDKTDHKVVGHTLHAVLYTLLIHYQLAEAVRLVELVLRLRDVRHLAAVYQMSDSSLADLLLSHCEVSLTYFKTFSNVFMFVFFVCLSCHTAYVLYYCNTMGWTWWDP